MDLEKLNKEIESFSIERDWNKFHSIKNLSMALSVECSELLEIFQWKTEEQSNQIINNQQELSQVQDELADIFIYLLKISSKLKIDLEKATLEKIIKNSKKYPIELSKGNSKKYTEF